MAFIPVPNTVSATLIYQVSGQEVVNVLHYTKASPWNLSSMEELATGLVAWWDGNLDSVLSTQTTLVGIRIVDLESQTAEVLEWTTGLPLAGTGAAPNLPNNVTMCVTKRTAKRGRSYRGRIYHPALRTDMVTGNTINLAAASQIANAYEQGILIDLPITVDEALMSVVSYVNEGQPRSTGEATLVTHMTFDQTVDSQRRRLPGRGA